MAQQRLRPANNANNTASASTTQTTTSAEPSFPIPSSGTLRLRAESVSTSEVRHIQWAEDVIDNEGMGKKSSKVCCIYHKPRVVGESSDEDSSDSSSSDDSDSGVDDGAAKPVRRSRARRRRHSHEHGHGGQGDAGEGKRKASPNAYERMPKYGTGKGKEKAKET